MRKFRHLCIQIAALSVLTGTAFAEDCASLGLKPNERKITLLGTNDIHGGVEPETLANGMDRGGMAFFTGMVKATRAGIAKQAGCAGSILVDAGDQFQGTLVSNYNEGELVFDLMNQAAYDAVVPGNHDYDFGPKGWLVDQVPAGAQGNPREVIESLAQRAKFPLLSANTYLKNTIAGLDGTVYTEVESAGCVPDGLVDWGKAKRPTFLQPYLLKTVAGVRVALIGLDNKDTSRMTTVENVSDLCFRDPVDEYLAIRSELEGKADLFVMVIHNGDASNDFQLSELMKKVTAARTRAVDVVFGGHTHFVNNLLINGVPGLQSGSGGQMFGRVDLIVDTATGTIRPGSMNAKAGLGLLHRDCDKGSEAFCTAPDRVNAPLYDGQRVVKDVDSETMIAKARTEVAPLASRVLGTAEKVLKRNRTEESAVANLLTDALREAAKTDLAMINTGGIRDDIEAGKVTYEALYKVIPFSNHAVVTTPMTTLKLVSLIKRSIQTCGSYGALMMSGVQVTFTRNCKANGGAVDLQAKLLTVTTARSERIYDGTGRDPVILDRVFSVATLDFLLAGGSGYDAFKDLAPRTDLGIFREALVTSLLETPGRWSGALDGRWKNLPAASGENE